jgi:hypothetical protein
MCTARCPSREGGAGVCFPATACLSQHSFLTFPNWRRRLEEEQEFKEFAAQPGAMDRIFARIAPQVRPHAHAMHHMLFTHAVHMRTRTVHAAVFAPRNLPAPPPCNASSPGLSHTVSCLLP